MYDNLLERVEPLPNGMAEDISVDFRSLWGLFVKHASRLERDDGWRTLAVGLCPPRWQGQTL